MKWPASQVARGLPSERLARGTNSRSLFDRSWRSLADAEARAASYRLSSSAHSGRASGGQRPVAIATPGRKDLPLPAGCDFTRTGEQPGSRTGALWHSSGGQRCLRSKAGFLPRGYPAIGSRESCGIGTPSCGTKRHVGRRRFPDPKFAHRSRRSGRSLDPWFGPAGHRTGHTKPRSARSSPMRVGVTNPTIQNSIFLPDIASLNSNTTTANVGYQQGFTSGGTLDVFFNNSTSESKQSVIALQPDCQLERRPDLHATAACEGSALKQTGATSKSLPTIDESVTRYFLQQLMATVSGVVRLYWDLQSLNGDVRVREEAVASASEQFLQDSRNQMEAGTFAEVDVTRAQAELSRRQRDLAVARSLVREQEAVVKDYITRGRVDGPLGKAPIVAIDPLPEPSPSETFSIDQLYAEAIHTRPEAAQVKIQLENAVLSLRGSQNGIRPELDLVATAENSWFGWNNTAGGSTCKSPFDGRVRQCANTAGT